MISEKVGFELLRKREILNILDGDKDFGFLKINGEPTEIKISMPYLKGSQLCDISGKFGLATSYGWGGSLSRWKYLDNLMEHCIKKGKQSDLLAFLFSKEQFADKLMGLSLESIDLAYTQIVISVIDEINKILYFYEGELVEVGGVFSVQKIDFAFTLETPSFKNVNGDYVTRKYNEALKDLMEGRYDCAITKSRTFLEDVFLHVIREKGEKPNEKGKIASLYNQVKKLYGMNQREDRDVIVNNLISGLDKILFSIAEMRNKAGDAHGVGRKRFNIKAYHARLFVNSAATMADFVLSVKENAVQQSFKKS